MLPIIQKSCMIFDVDVWNREEAIRQMAECLYQNGYIKDMEVFCRDVYAREAIYPTCIGNGIGIPHGKSEGVKETGVCMMRLNHPVLWNQREYVDIIFLLAVEKKETKEDYLKILANLSKNLLYPEFVKSLKEGDKESVYSLLKEKENG